MQPLPMNELVKSQLDAAGFEVSSNRWTGMRCWRSAAPASTKYPEIDAINIAADARPVQRADPPVWTAQWAPKGTNWGHYGNPEMDKLVGQIFGEFDTGKRLALLTKLNETG